MNKQYVEYVSGQPGSGKTRAAIKMMVDHIVNRRPGAIFYCAPIHKLLTQTLRHLETGVGDKKLMVAKVTHIRSRAYHQTSFETPYDIGSRRAKVNEQLDVLFQQDLDGRVVLLAHDGFMKIKTHHKLSEITMLFDESRHWVTIPKDVKLDEPTRILVKELFSIVPMRDDATGRPVKSRIKLLEPNRVSGKRRGELLNSANSKSFTAVVTLHRDSLPDDEGVRRTLTYCLVKSSASGIKSLVLVTLPHQAFAGYKRTIFLCANFEDSQLAHLMQRYHIKCVDITEKFMVKYLGRKEFDRAQGAITRRYRKVVLGYLIDSPDMPSSYLLESGCIVTKGSEDEYTEMARAQKTGDDVDHKAVSRIVVAPNAKYENVYWWLEGQAAALARRWQSNPRFGDRGCPLLFYNEAHAKKNHDKLFDYVNHADVIGLNDYKERNVVAFLAATNPTPDISAVLKMLLSGTDYDCDKDFTVTKAIQCIGRGNVRDQRSDEFMLAIVPTRGLAEKIQEQLGGAEHGPKIPDKMLPGIQQVSIVKRVESNGNRKGTNNRDESWPELTREQKLLRNRLNVQKTRSKQAGDMKRVAELEIEIQKLREAATK